VSIIQRIYELLEKKQKKPAELARFIGVSTGQMSTWKTRDTDPPAKFMPAIAEFLAVSLEFLLSGHEKELPKNMILTEGYDFAGNKVTISEEQAAIVRDIINKELNERVEEAVRKVLKKDVPIEGNKE
jgi:transcriptional regulator with XRE-family HTH domain